MIWLAQGFSHTCIIRNIQESHKFYYDQHWRILTWSSDHCDHMCMISTRNLVAQMTLQSDHSLACIHSVSQTPYVKFWWKNPTFQSHVHFSRSHLMPKNKLHNNQRDYHNFKTGIGLTLIQDIGNIIKWNKFWRLEGLAPRAKLVQGDFASRMGCWWLDCAPSKPRDGREQDW